MTSGKYEWKSIFSDIKNNEKGLQSSILLWMEYVWFLLEYCAVVVGLFSSGASLIMFIATNHSDQV